MRTPPLSLGLAIAAPLPPPIAVVPDGDLLGAAVRAILLTLPLSLLGMGLCLGGRGANASSFAKTGNVVGGSVAVGSTVFGVGIFLFSLAGLSTDFR